MTNTTSWGVVCSLRNDADEEKADIPTRKSRSASCIDGPATPAATASSTEAYTDLSTQSRPASSVENEVPSAPANRAFQEAAVEGSAIFSTDPGIIVGAVAAASEAAGAAVAEADAAAGASAAAVAGAAVAGAEASGAASVAAVADPLLEPAATASSAKAGRGVTQSEHTRQSMIASALEGGAVRDVGGRVRAERSVRRCMVPRFRLARTAGA